jgi:hypothetical protein
MSGRESLQEYHLWSSHHGTLQYTIINSTNILTDRTSDFVIKLVPFLVGCRFLVMALKNLQLTTSAELSLSSEALRTHTTCIKLSLVPIALQ